MIARKVRIDMGDYDASWTDSYILFKSQSFKNIFDFQDKIEELNKKSDTSSGAYKVVAKIADFLKENFVSGMIYDDDLKALRPFVKEDIDELDTEIIRDLLALVFGNLSKKK